MEDLISIIVPIYNVDAYLKRCVDSILNQTYRNLEIILVDDGSTDNCGIICDNYAKIDHRIKVIHQKNGGLSAARNTGLSVCRGMYVGFVDSDDFIHPDMYNRLYQDIKRYNVKLAFCQTEKCVPSYALSLENSDISKPTVCKDKDYVIQRSMIENIWWSANTKLYLRSLFCDTHYPVGKTNEDYPVTISIYDKCKFIAVNYNALYYYCIRENSICTSPLNIRKFDQIGNALEVLHYMQHYHPNWEAAAEFVFLTTLLKLLGDVFDDNNKQFEEQKRYILLLIKKHILSALKNKHLLRKQKLMLLFAYVHPLAFRFIHELYRKRQLMKQS